MSKADFDALVQRAMRSGDVAGLKPVIEKELLHYEIFAALDRAGLLRGLVFQGGTSLRLCWGAERFSEDLDFAAGPHLDVEAVRPIKECIESSIGERYGLPVRVKEPDWDRDKSSEHVPVRAWVVSVMTSPGNPALPQQKIKIELAAVRAHTREIVPLRKNYDFLEGTATVVVPVESRNEILADKIVALPSSLFGRDGEPVPGDSRKIRHRDIWDIAWLLRNGAQPDPDLVRKKVSDYGLEDFDRRLQHAVESVHAIASSEAFQAQMSRFLDPSTFRGTLGRPEYLQYLGGTVRDVLDTIRACRESALDDEMDRSAGR